MPPSKSPSSKNQKPSQGPAIFEEAYSLMLLLYPYIQAFPKSQRFVLGQRIEQTCVTIIAGIVEANMRKDKLPALQAISIELEKLRLFTRLAKDLQFIDFKKYETLSKKTDGIGRMLGGWLKWAGGENEKIR